MNGNHTRALILDMLKRTPKPTQKQLAAHAGISKKAISKQLRKLAKEGLVRSHGRTTNCYYELVGESRKLVGSGKLDVSEARIGTTKLQLRLHRMMRTYMLLSKPNPESLRKLKEVVLNNNVQHIGAGFRITTQHLALEGIELYASRTTSVALLPLYAAAYADSLAKNLAQQYGLEIDIANAKSKLLEIELTEHEMVERVEKRGIIPLHHDASGKADVWIDKSIGLGGFESSNADYLQKLTNFTNEIVEGRWSIGDQLKLNQQTIEYRKSLLDSIDKKLAFMADNQRSHAKAIQNLNKFAIEATSLLRKLSLRFDQSQPNPSALRVYTNTCDLLANELLLDLGKNNEK